ncbi:MAG: homoprotocatechuate degradation operon regulator HpaR [Steroidobacteraceae bacterium]
MRSFDRSLPMALLRAREAAMGLFRPQLKACGLTEQQWRVIRALHSHGEMEFQNLARLICVQPPSLTSMLVRLEKLGLIRRRRPAGDRRRLFVSVSRKGSMRFQAISKGMEKIYRDIEAQLGEQRLQLLLKLLAQAQQLRPRDTAPPPAGRARKSAA